MAGGTPSSGVAIIGSGVAGLHLALLLQKQGIPVTLYSDKTAAQLATFSASGHVTVLLFENVPGGDTEVLADAKYDEDPAAFERLMLAKVRVHHPQVFQRIDTARFGLTGPEDLLQGAVTPARQPGASDLRLDEPHDRAAARTAPAPVARRDVAEPGRRGRVHRQLQPAGAPVGHPGTPRAHERVSRASWNAAAVQADDPGPELTRAARSG